MSCSISSLEVANMVSGKSDGSLGSPLLSPSLQSMINSFNAEGKGKEDRDLFLALLGAKTAEDKRLEALDNFRAEQLRAANTLYAHSAYQAQQEQHQAQHHQQGFVNSSSSSSRYPPSTSSYRQPRTPLSPPSTSTSISTTNQHQFSREPSQTPSNFSSHSKSLVSPSTSSTSKRKTLHRRPVSSSGSSSSMGLEKIERELDSSSGGGGNHPQQKRTKINPSSSTSTSNSKPSHVDAMNALRARCERNNRDRQFREGRGASGEGLTNEGGRPLFKSVSLPLSSSSSQSNNNNDRHLSPHPSPALSSVSTNASSIFSPPLPSPATPTNLNHNHYNPVQQQLSNSNHLLTREEAKFLSISSQRPIVEIMLPGKSLVGEEGVVETIQPVTKSEGTSASLRRLLNSSSSTERTTVTRVSDVRGE